MRFTHQTLAQRVTFAAGSSPQAVAEEVRILEDLARRGDAVCVRLSAAGVSAATVARAVDDHQSSFGGQRRYEPVPGAIVHDQIPEAVAASADELVHDAIEPPSAGWWQSGES